MELIQIFAAGMSGFGILPSISIAEGEAIIANLKKGMRVAFIDLAPSDGIVSFLKQLSQLGVEVVAFYDHHFEGKKNEVKNVEAIRRDLREMAVIKTREEAISCVSLITEGIWHDLTLDAIFFHADPDGFLAFLKGCHLVYLELDADSAIFEGASGNQSWFGKLLGDAQNNLPPYFSFDPLLHQQTLCRIYQTLADYLESNQSLYDFYVEVEEARKKAKEQLLKLAENAQVLPGKVVFCDCLPEIKAGRNINFSTLQAELKRKFGTVLVCTTGTGHLGEMVFIQLPKEWGRIDLRKFLPKGLKSNVPGRIQVPLSRFDEFLALWLREFPSGPK